MYEYYDPIFFGTENVRYEWEKEAQKKLWFNVRKKERKKKSDLT